MESDLQEAQTRRPSESGRSASAELSRRIILWLTEDLRCRTQELCSAMNLSATNLSRLKHGRRCLSLAELKALESWSSIPLAVIIWRCLRDDYREGNQNDVEQKNAFAEFDRYIQSFYQMHYAALERFQHRRKALTSPLPQAREAIAEDNVSNLLDLGVSQKLA